MAFVQSKAKAVLVNQNSGLFYVKSWRLPTCAQKLIQGVSKSLQHLGCSLQLCSDLQVILRWIINPDFHLHVS